jgi:hypothetical protein
MICVDMCFSLYSHACLSFFHSTDTLSLYSNSLTGTIPSQLGLLTKLSKLSVVFGCLFVMICVVMCFSLYSHACMSFFILQICCLSMTIISQVNSRALLTLLMNVTFPVMTTTMIHADPFRET